MPGRTRRNLPRFFAAVKLAAAHSILYKVPGRCPGREVELRKILAGLALAGLLALSATAQDADKKGPFGGFKHDRSAPLDIASDNLEIRQAEERAIFTGSVVAAQGTLRLTAARMIVEYDEDKQDSSSETGAITRVEANGDVFLSNGAETAQGNWAEYNLETGIVKLRGDVILTQGENAARGKSLVIDLNTGVARMEGRPTITFKPSKSGETDKRSTN